MIKEHERIFPGVDTKSLNKQSKYARSDATDVEGTNVYLGTHTWCTSFVFAWISWCMTSGKRSSDDRLRAFNLLKHIITYFVTTLGNVTLTVTRCGDMVQSVVTLDPSLRVKSCYLWTLASFRKIENKWNNERCSKRHPWITSDAQNPTVLEYMAFCLEHSADHSANGMCQLIMPAAAMTMSALCEMVHANLTAVARLRRNTIEHEKFTEYKNRRQFLISQNNRMCECAMFLLHESASCIDLQRATGLVVIISRDFLQNRKHVAAGPFP